MPLDLLVGAQEPPLIDLDGTVYVQVALFLVLLAVLTRFLYRPYLEAVAARDRAIEGRRAEARELDARARARIAEVERHLDEARARGAGERARIRAEAAEREREVLEGARREAARAIADARGRLDRQVRDLRAELRPAVDALGRLAAARVLGREVN